MLCSEVEARLFDLLDGRMSGPDEVRAHGHLETCPGCRERVATWRRALPGMRAAEPPAPDFLRVRRMELAVVRELAKAPSPAQPSRRRRLWWVSGLALAAAAALLVVGRGHLLPTGPLVRAEAVSGPVTVAGASVREGEAAIIGRPLEVGQGGRVSLALGRGTSIRVADAARFTVAEAAAVVRIRLEAGQLEAEVAPRRAGERFAVELRGGHVEVRGTRFAVGYDGEASWLRVHEGTVAAYDPAGQLVRLVSAGETHWLSPRTEPAPVPPVPAPAPAPPASDSCAELQRSCSTAVARTRAAIRASDPGRAIAASAAEGVAVGGCGLDRARQCLDELQYLRAEALRLGGRLPAAVVAYRALDRANASAATRQNALFAAAELERRLGRRSAALRDYQRALAVTGADGLREEAMLGIMDTAAESGETAAAVTAARRYLDSYPSGHGAPRARALLARQGAAVP
jgi:ferric-dicitrate binding protein FerR (iron transport regulator)